MKWIRRFEHMKRMHNQNIILRQTHKVQRGEEGRGGVRDKHHIPPIK